MPTDMALRKFSDELKSYRETWLRDFPGRASFYPQSDCVGQFEKLLGVGPEAFLRDHYPGHFTASGVVITNDYQHVLLTLHRKLNLWLQLGGHADGECDLKEVAIKELEEESGISGVVPTSLASHWSGRQDSPNVFDLDIHEIPARLNEPLHYHFDVRFLFKVPHRVDVVISEESTDLKWFEVAEAYQLTDEPSTHRLFDKIQFLEKKL